MNWYLAKIVYRIICGEGQHKPQFDEQLRLINANNEEEAMDKAKSLGLHEQDSFVNQKDQLVQWRFINISELYKLTSLKDGAELYSRIQETEDATAYTDTVNKKAEQIRSAFITDLTRAF
jgi:Domain of unknown function (DUF4288)